MRNQAIENQIEFLLSAALNKCENFEDAQDLTQETFLAALDYVAKGGVIKELRGWLLTVLNRKFYQNLRRKYKMPTITFGDDFDIVDEKDCFVNIGQTDEAAQVRKAVAYLSEIYREVIIRHYMRGESVQKIAELLRIPPGTVKSRLSAGREQLKKELVMDSYREQSYEPIKLSLSNSGVGSIKNEPQSLVDGDLIAQNLLYLAYREPLTELDLSKAIGIPMAYVEPIIKKLVDGELMKRVGNKVYTDFMIDTLEGKAKHMPAVKQFVADNQDLFFTALKEALAKLKRTDFYAHYTEHQKQAIELYTAAYCYESGLIRAFHEIYDTEQILPERPNGGRWIAFGHVIAPPEKSTEYLEVFKHSFCGMRTPRLDNYWGAKRVEFSAYDLEGFPIRIYYSTGGEHNIGDEDLLKLLYVIESGTSTEDSGFNIELLKKIPWLVKCGILRYDENNKPAVDVPIVTAEECRIYNQIRIRAKDDFIKDIKPIFADFLQDKKQEIPAHVTSVPLLKQYQTVVVAPLMAAIRLALKQGIINSAYDYDDDSDRDKRFPYTMLFYMDK